MTMHLWNHSNTTVPMRTEIMFGTTIGREITICVAYFADKFATISRLIARMFCVSKFTFVRRNSDFSWMIHDTMHVRIKIVLLAVIGGELTILMANVACKIPIFVASPMR